MLDALMSLKIYFREMNKSTMFYYVFFLSLQKRQSCN